MDDLIIKRVEVFGVAVPLKSTYKTAHSTKSLQKSVIIRIATDTGIGLGNVSSPHSTSDETVEQILDVLRDRLGPSVIGLNAANVHCVLRTLRTVMPGFLPAKAAIEMACVDLVARANGVSVHTWLGGAVKERLLFNAWIGILAPEDAAREALSWFEKGFRFAKVKVGGNIEHDRDRIAAIRDAVGATMVLRVDANAGYDAETSIKLGRMLERFDLQLFEQPVPADDLAGMARVRNALAIPIMADESVRDHASLIRIIEMKAADIVKLKVMKQGGFLNTCRMIATAEAAGLRCILGHGFGLGINTAAEIMAAATSENVMDGLECVGPLKTADDVVVEKLDLSTGSLPLPRGPGLAVELNEEKLMRYRFDCAEHEYATT